MQLRFYARQFIDAISPSNFPATNPEVIRKAIETRSVSLTDGMQNFIDDLQKGRITRVDESIRDIQVLCPMNRGSAGARSLNIELQAALNPAGDRKVERFGWTFAPGDKVMQIENDYEKEVYNGDIGTIDDVDSNSGELIASFDGRSVTYGFGELDMLVPAYAATIHKSQGSEYPAVIIPVLTQHYAMLQRNLLYTGVTRGKKLVVLVGQKKAVAIAVRNVSGRKRWSKLSEWLRPKPPVSRQFGMAS